MIERKGGMEAGWEVDLRWNEVNEEGENLIREEQKAKVELRAE